MRTIPVFDNSTGLFQAGEEIDRIWDTYRKKSGNFHKESTAIFHRFGSSCPSSGCGHCGNPDCFFSDFIRDYCDYPHGN